MLCITGLSQGSLLAARRMCRKQRLACWLSFHQCGFVMGMDSDDHKRAVSGAGEGNEQLGQVEGADSLEEQVERGDGGATSAVPPGPGEAGSPS